MRLIFSGLLLCIITGQSYAATETLQVGVREIPPFVMKQPDGRYTGVSIELWQRIASQMNLNYEYHSKDLAGLLEGLKSGELDVAVAALTVTAEREQYLDFSHPFHSSGLSIAVPRTPSGAWATLRAAFSLEFVSALAVLVLLLMTVGVIIWLLERRANPGQFGGKPHEGVGSGFWWSAVTMTTVGYGDKAPVTAAGRFVAILWMFFSVITISGFTATIASVFTVQQLSGPVSGPNDLNRVIVGTLRGSTSEKYLLDNGIRAQYYESINSALKALPKQQIGAVVYDEPIMRYLVNTAAGDSLEVLPGSFVRQDYAFGLPSSSKLREPLNRALLETLSDPAWSETLESYLGK
ncbi:MAG: transporter substrate-binding domain-containing protein [Gammaproteobacteria bacterium]|nr:transporter substrate-binding domain-containing protein [Gammaproteobacteria bacterium]